MFLFRFGAEYVHVLGPISLLLPLLPAGLVPLVRALDVDCAPIPLPSMAPNVYPPLTTPADMRNFWIFCRTILDCSCEGRRPGDHPFCNDPEDRWLISSMCVQHCTCVDWTDDESYNIGSGSGKSSSASNAPYCKKGNEGQAAFDFEAWEWGDDNSAEESGTNNRKRNELLLLDLIECLGT